MDVQLCVGVHLLGRFGEDNPARTHLAIANELGSMRPGPRQPTGDEFLIKSCHSLIVAFRARTTGIPVRNRR